MNLENKIFEIDSKIKDKNLKIEKLLKDLNSERSELGTLEATKKQVEKVLEETKKLEKLEKPSKIEKPVKVETSKLDK